MDLDESKRYAPPWAVLHQLGNDPVVASSGWADALAAIAGHGDAGPCVPRLWLPRRGGRHPGTYVGWPSARDKGKAPADILQAGLNVWPMVPDRHRGVPKYTGESHVSLF